MKLSKDQQTAIPITYIGKAQMTLPHEVIDLARQLSAIHGKIRVSQEASGTHFNLASPECLQLYGASELHKMHLSINVDKWLAGEDSCALCMKTETPYRVTDLVSMVPLSQRGFKDQPEVTFADASTEDFLEPDSKGNMVPFGPGLVVPVFELPEDHPARVYLTERNFNVNVKRLYEQFRLSYCLTEREGVYRRQLINGFRATPQGRLIFFMDVDGVSRGWQARVLELDRGDRRWFFHPYCQDWQEVLEKVDGRWRPLPGWEDWEMPKYIIGNGAKRNQVLMGYDAAVAWNKSRPGQKRICVVSEGACDVGRVGPPGIALLGKFMSELQAELLGKAFQVLIYVSQNDKVGREAKATIAERMKKFPTLDVYYADVVNPYKDLGEMPENEARKLITGIYPTWN